MQFNLTHCYFKLKFHHHFNACLDWANFKLITHLNNPPRPKQIIKKMGTRPWSQNCYSDPACMTRLTSKLMLLIRKQICFHFFPSSSFSQFWQSFYFFYSCFFFSALDGCWIKCHGKSARNTKRLFPKKLMNTFWKLCHNNLFSFLFYLEFEFGELNYFTTNFSLVISGR